MGKSTLFGILLVALILVAVPWAVVYETAPDVPSSTPMVPVGHEVEERGVELDLSGLGSLFEENLGQYPGEGAGFFVRSPGVTIEAGVNGVSMHLEDPTSGARHTITIGFEGGREVVPAGARAAHTTSYFVGNDLARWVRAARSFEEVVYEGIYEGVDARFHIMDGMLKYDIILSGEADPSEVRIRYAGSDRLEVDHTTGDLLIHTPLGVLRDTRPLVKAEGTDAWVEASYTLEGEFCVGFVLPHDIPRDIPMVIDPGIKYSTFLGGNSGDYIYDIEIGDDGSIYALVYSMSANLPLSTGAFGQKIEQNFPGIYVAKFDPHLTTLKKATYVDASDYDSPEALKVLPDGSVLVTGTTSSSDFPVTQDALMPDYTGNDDAFLFKLNPGFDDLVYSTYLGGNGDDDGLKLLVGDDGDVVVLGTTLSSDLNTTAGAIDSTLGGATDAFVWKLDSTLKVTKMLTYFGSEGIDHLRDGAIAPTGELVLLVDVGSDNMTTHAGAFMATPPPKNPGALYTFILKLSIDGTYIQAATYMSGNQSDVSEAVLVDRDGRIYVTIATVSHDLPLTPNALQDEVLTTSPDRTAFLGALDGDLSTLEYGTYYGGTDATRATYMALSRDGAKLAITGRTIASDLQLTPGCFDTLRRGSDDAYLAIFNTTSWELDYATMWGDTETDSIKGIEFDSDGYLVIGGYSEKFPMVQGAYRTTPENGIDPLLAVFDPVPEDSPPGVAPTLVLKSSNATVQITWDVITSFTSREISYRLYRGLNRSGNDRELLNETGFEVLTYTDEDVINGIEYFYWITAVNVFGEGPLSSVASAKPVGTPYNPGNMVLTTGDGTVNVSWEPPISDGGLPLKGWRIYRGVTRDDLGLIANLDDGAATYYVDSDTELVVGEFYYYTIECYNSYGTGPRSPPKRIAVLDTPAMPPNFKVVPGDARVALTWGMPSYDGGTAIVGFRVYRMTGGGPMELIATLDRTKLAFADTNVTNGRSYTYMVVAYTNVGEGRSTEAIDAIPFTLPGKVLTITATPGIANVTLIWTPPAFDGGSRITGYTLYWGTDAGNLDQTHLLGNVTSFVHRDLPNGVAHYYQITPENAAGLGPVSAVVHATPMGLPGRVVGLSAQAVSGGIKLTWSVPLDMGGADSLTYQVLRSTSGDPVDLLVELVDAFEHMDTGLTKGTTYRYRVVATSLVGEGDRGIVVEATAIEAPSKVDTLEFTVGNAQVDLTWSAPDDGGSEIVEYIVLKGVFENTVAELDRVTTTSYTDTDVENGKTYYYAVQAVNALGGGPRSDAVSAKPLGPPPPPGVLTAKVKQGKVQLTWAAPATGNTAEVTGYKIYRGDSEYDLQLLEELGMVTSYVDDDIKKDRTYYYKVVAVSPSGDSEMSRLAKGRVVSEEEPGFGVLLAALALTGTALVATRVRTGRRRG